MAYPIDLTDSEYGIFVDCVLKMPKHSNITIKMDHDGHDYAEDIVSGRRISLRGLICEIMLEEEKTKDEFIRLLGRKAEEWNNMMDRFGLNKYKVRNNNG